MQSSFRYQDLFRYRSVWMGVAILWVVLYHSGINLSWIMWLKSFGYGGVDIFFFASGLGCCYSLQKQSDPWLFLRKRFYRILPLYYPVLIVWIILRIVLFKTQFTFPQIMSNLLCTGTFWEAENQFNWYISAVWPSYLLAPLLVRYANHTTGLRRLLPLPLLFLLSTCFLSSTWNLLSFSCRMPLFYLGILFAKTAQEKPAIRTRTIVGWVVLSAAGILLMYLSNTYAGGHMMNWGLWWYPFLLIVPGVCLLLSVLCLTLEKLCHWVIALLTILGGCSFELYLIHLTVNDGITYLMEQDIYQPNNSFWCILIACCCGVSALLHKLMKPVLSPSAPVAA